MHRVIGAALVVGAHVLGPVAGTKIIQAAFEEDDRHRQAHQLGDPRRAVHRLDQGRDQDHPVDAGGQQLFDRRVLLCRFVAGGGQLQPDPSGCQRVLDPLQHRG